MKLYNSQRSVVVVLLILIQKSIFFSIFDFGYCSDRNYFDSHWYTFCETSSDELKVYQELDFEIEREIECVCVCV